MFIIPAFNKTVLVLHNHNVDYVLNIVLNVLNVENLHTEILMDNDSVI